jgi:hypothetical protein
MTNDDTIADALAKLRPAAPGTNLPALMYRAGQASRDRAVAAWRAAFAVAAVALGGTWTTVLAFPEQLPLPQPPGGPPPESDMNGSNLAAIGRAMVGGGSRGAGPERLSLEPPPVSHGPYREYLRVRDAVLADGLAGLPPTPPPPDRVTAAELASWLGHFH